MSQHITVLLAAYNGASYIEEQIRSILGLMMTLPMERWSFWNGYRRSTRLCFAWLPINGKAIIRIGGIRFRLLP